MWEVEQELDAINNENHGILALNSLGNNLGDSHIDYVQGDILVEFKEGDLNFIVIDDGNEGNSELNGDALVKVTGGRTAYIQGNMNNYKDSTYTNRVLFSGGKAEIGYLYYLDKVQLENEAEVTIDSEKFPEFNSIQKPFYSVNDLIITENSYLTTRNSSTSIENNVTMDSGTWHAKGYVYIDEKLESRNSNILWDNYYQIGYAHKEEDNPSGTVRFQSENDTFSAMYTRYLNQVYGDVSVKGGTWSLMSRTVINGAAVFDDLILQLPVIQEGENYTDGDIPLKINGVASGDVSVVTVQADRPAGDEPMDASTWTAKKVCPQLGDNYITGYAPEGTTTDIPPQDTFILRNEDAVAQGYYLKRVTDADSEYAEDYYMWQVAKDTTLTLRPEDQTIYSGGENGDVINPEFPHPIYLMKSGGVLPENVTFKVNGTEWSDPINEYPFTVKYYDKDDNEITDDQHYGDFTARIVPVEGVDADAAIATSDGRTVKFEDGTLRIRYVSSFTDATANALTTDALEYADANKEAVKVQAENRGEAAVLLPESTTIYLNGNPNYEYPESAPYQIALLFDELLPTTQGGSNQTYVDTLTAHAKETGFDLTGMETMFRYLDLVDTNNSNAWVSSSEGCDVFWPYPAGTNQSTDFQVLHFEGLHREYSMDGTSSSLQQQIAASKVESVNFEKTDAGIWFHVGESGFSPFALAWTAKGGGENPGGSGGNRPGGGSGGGTTHYILHYESNGGTEYDDERYAKNTVVDLDKVPTREGYTFTGWYADEELTERITEIKMTSNKTVYAGWEATGVPDLLNGRDHFAYVIGYADGTVRPLDNISRAEVATIIFRLLDPEVRDEYLTTTNTFKDVNEGMWCNTAISTLARLGIVYGRSAQIFDPDASITRAEFAAICARFDDSGIEADSSFSDISGHWAEDEIERAATLGWIRGYTDGTFRPNNLITRAEAMTMINRMLQRLPEDEDDLLGDMNIWPDNQPGDWYYLAVQEATNSHDFNRKSDGVHEHWTELTADPDWKQYEE